MKRKYSSLLICTITILFLIEIFIHTELVLNSFYQGTILWFKNIVPFLFPFLIITDILSNYHLINYISRFFGKIIHNIFRIPKEAAYAFFMSLFSGFPGNSKFIKELLDDNIITESDATKLLTFTHFSNPLFIIGTIGITFLDNKQIGFIILITHFLVNIVVGFLFRNIYYEEKIIYQKKERVTLPFIPLLKKSISNNINTLFLIYGIIIFFSIITTIINTNINLSPLNASLLNGLLEMTNGLKMVSMLDINIVIKATIMTFFISFGGFSIHMQVMSILSDYKVNYFIYLLSRIIHAGISSLLVYFILTNY